MSNDNGHHVAWKDRIGLSDRWEEAIKGCYYNWGSPSFYNNLDALTNLIVDIKNGPQLHTLINKKISELDTIVYHHMEQWCKTHPDHVENPSYVRDEEKRFRQQYASKELFHFIIQLLEDNGFGFYKSKDLTGSDKVVDYDD